MNLSSFVHTHLNGFKYCYQTLIIQFDINYLFAHSQIVLSIVTD